MASRIYNFICRLSSRRKLGRKLLEGAKKVKVLGEEISVKARIVNMDGFSAHADYSQMEEWLQHLTMYNAKQVFVVHGEATASKAVKEMIEEEFGWNAYIPFYADRAIMTKNTCEIKAANIPSVSSSTTELFLILPLYNPPKI